MMTELGMTVTLEELLAAIQVVLDRNHPQTTKQFRDLQDELLRLRREKEKPL